MTEYNGVMMQYFHWYTPADGNLWRQLKEEADKLDVAYQAKKAGERQKVS